MKKNKKILIVIVLIVGFVGFRWYTKNPAVRVKSIASNYNFKITDVTTVKESERSKKNRFNYYYLTLNAPGFEELSDKDKIKFQKDVYYTLTNRDKNPRVIVEVQEVIDNNNKYTFELSRDYGTMLYKNGELIDKERTKRPESGLPNDKDFKKVEEGLRDFYKSQGK